MTLNEYQQRAFKTALPTEKTTVYMGFGLCSETGEVAGKLKKWHRGDYLNHEQLWRENVSGEVGDVLWYLAGLCTMLGLSLEDIAAENLAKLADRQERGAIQGEGDKR